VRMYPAARHLREHNRSQAFRPPPRLDHVGHVPGLLLQLLEQLDVVGVGGPPREKQQIVGLVPPRLEPVGAERDRPGRSGSRVARTHRRRGSSRLLYHSRRTDLTVAKVAARVVRSERPAAARGPAPLFRRGAACHDLRSASLSRRQAQP
jgi:hypothetical protein